MNLFPTEYQIPSTDSSQILKARGEIGVSVFCPEFLTKCTLYFESSYAVQVEGLNLRILGNAEMETAQTNAMDPWQSLFVEGQPKRHQVT